MTIPTFTLVGGIKRVLSSEVDVSYFANRKVLFTPNIPPGVVLGQPGGPYTVDPVVADLDDNGELSYQGGNGVELVANDPANPLPISLQWEVAPGPGWAGTTTFKSWWFIAGAPDEEIDLEHTARQPRLLANGHVVGPDGTLWNKLVGRPDELIAGPNEPGGYNALDENGQMDPAQLPPAAETRATIGALAGGIDNASGTPLTNKQARLVLDEFGNVDDIVIEEV